MRPQFKRVMKVRVPPGLRSAMEIAAHKEHSTLSDFIRRMMIDRLRADGVLLNSPGHEAVAASGRSGPVTVGASHAVTPGDEHQNPAVRGCPRVAHLAYPCSRAAVVTTAIIQIIETAPANELRGAIEAYVRDEFADVERQIAAERSCPDA